MIRARNQKYDILTRFNERTMKLNDHSEKHKIHEIILKDHVTRKPITKWEQYIIKWNRRINFAHKAVTAFHIYEINLIIFLCNIVHKYWPFPSFINHKTICSRMHTLKIQIFIQILHIKTWRLQQKSGFLDACITWGVIR